MDFFVGEVVNHVSQRHTYRVQVSSISGSVVFCNKDTMAFSLDTGKGIANQFGDCIAHINPGNPPPAACGMCGGWISMGGMSQYRQNTDPVEGRIGCQCNNGILIKRLLG